MFIPDQNIFSIPDPGVKKAPDSGLGSATLLRPLRHALFPVSGSAHVLVRYDISLDPGKSQKNKNKSKKTNQKHHR
jgi:hypothetical protein